MAPMAPRLIFFDLDGTLIDHFRAIHRSYAHTLPRLGLPAPSYAEVRAAVGGGLERAMLRFVAPARLEEAVAIYRAYFNATLLDDVELLAGALPLLRALQAKGCRSAVLTNKLGSASRAICQHLGLTPYLAGIYGAGDTPWLKPQPDFAAHALRELGAAPAQTLLVGDSPFDVETGRTGGFPCWAVTTGTHDADQLRTAGASQIYADLASLGVDLLRAI